MTKLALIVLLAASGGCPGEDPLETEEVRQRMAEATCDRTARCSATDFESCVVDTVRSLSRRTDWPNRVVTELDMGACEDYIAGLSCAEEHNSDLWFAPECDFGGH